MYIPEGLRQLPLAEWNHLVKGIVEVWDLAEMLGAHECLDRHLRHDKDGQLATLLGCLGCDKVVPPELLHRLPKHDGAARDEAIGAYLRATVEDAFPDDEAYRGARMVRAFLEQMEEFGRSHALTSDEMCALTREALFLYRCTNPQH